MTRMKDIASSHKSFPKDKEIINIASFSGMHAIKSSLDSYFEHSENHTATLETEKSIIQEDSPSEHQDAQRLEKKEEVEKIIENKQPKPQKADVVVESKSNTPAELYSSLTQAINIIKEKIEKSEQFGIEELLSLIPKLVKYTLEENVLLTKALNPGRATEWFASHSVNTTILAIKISAGLNYNKKQMYALALTTLLHDVGMLKLHPDILNSQGKLTTMQKMKVNNHPKYGLNIIAHLNAKYPFIGKTIIQEHERWDGSGYPNHLKGDQITPFARIISLADKFESLIHERSYRPAFKPPLAIQKIINENHDAFDPKVLKAFINEISMYPVGSYVMLNTGQIAQVMSINKNRPVRPMVRLLTSNDGKQLENPESLNLEKEPLTYITKTVSYID